MACLCSAGDVVASEVGHYNGGTMNIRDYFVPEPGSYVAVYNYFYLSDRVTDAHGDSIDAITLHAPGGATATLDLDLDLEAYALAPALIWVSDWKPFGWKYGVVVTPSYVDTGIAAALSAATGRGGDINGGSSGMGDLMVQPLWLGRTTEHWDVALAYGYYAPVGQYDTEQRTLPIIGPVTVESPDNVGSGFGTEQFQGAVAWYPRPDKATALVGAVTYELHGKKEDFDLRPGDNLTINWGLSQYLPLRDSLLLELGISGYNSWQISDDNGSAANNVRDQVHAAGVQAGLSYLPWQASLTFLGYYEYAAEDRFQGTSFSINLGKQF